MNTARYPPAPVPRMAVLNLACGMLGSLFATTAQAERYVGGLSHPGAFSNVILSDPAPGGGISGARINDLELKSTLAGGVTADYFFADRPWLGVETDLFTLKPDAKQQEVVGGKTGGRSSAIRRRESPFGSRREQPHHRHSVILAERRLSALWRHGIRPLDGR